MSKRNRNGRRYSSRKLLVGSSIAAAAVLAGSIVYYNNMEESDEKKLKKLLNELFFKSLQLEFSTFLLIEHGIKKIGVYADIGFEIHKINKKIKEIEKRMNEMKYEFTRFETWGELEQIFRDVGNKMARENICSYSVVDSVTLHNIGYRNNDTRLRRKCKIGILTELLKKFGHYEEVLEKFGQNGEIRKTYLEIKNH